MLEALDGPTLQTKLTGITTTTPVEARVGGSAYSERKVVTIQPNANIRVWFAETDSTPLAATVSDNGFLHYKDAKETYEAGPKQKIWILAISGTVDVIVAERA